MNERLIQQIRSSMEAKSTEELLKIWEENNREEYSDEAFEAIKQLLTERGITLPPQKPFQKRLAKSGIEQMNRPKKVSLALKLLYLSLGFYILQFIINIGYLLERGELYPITQETSTITDVLLSTIYTVGVRWFLIYMIGKGRNWARIVYIANYTTEVMIYLIILPPLLAINIIFGIFYITQTILQVIAMVLLFQKPSSEWFRHKRADTLKSLGKEKRLKK
jgi:membrane-associated HD superfamily phosphohydrolase